jgi:hypothetical protein
MKRWPLLAMLSVVAALPLAPAAQDDAAATVRRDVTGSDRGRRLAAFLRYAANGDEAIARHAVEAAMASEDWLLQAAVMRSLFSKLGMLPVSVSISPDFPRADPARLGDGGFELRLGRLTPALITFAGNLQASPEPPATTSGRGGARLGGARRPSGPRTFSGFEGSGQLIGTVLTLGGPNNCTLQLVLSEPWIMTGRMHCLGPETYAARADLRNAVAATHPIGPESDISENLSVTEREALNRQRRQLDQQSAPPPAARVWAVTDPAERAAIDRDAKLVNELLGLLRRPASAEVLGALEALVEEGSSVASDIVLEAGLASSLPAARQLAFHMVLARTKTLLLIEDGAAKTPALSPAGAAFAVIANQEYPIGATIGRNVPLEAIAPGARFSGLLSQFQLDGLMLVPNYTGEGHLRLSVDEFGRIRAVVRTVEIGPRNQRGVTTMERTFFAPAVLR